MDATHTSAPPETSTRERATRRAAALTRAIRESYQRAYEAGVTDADEMAKRVYKDIADWRTNDNTERAWLFYIKNALRLPKTRASEAGDQSEFDYHSLDEFFPIKRAEERDPSTGEIVKVARTDQVMLGDFGLPEIHQHDLQLRANIDSAIAEQVKWERVKQMVVPLLETHPSWRYRDAIHHLKANGDLADDAPAA